MRLAKFLGPCTTAENRTYVSAKVAIHVVWLLVHENRQTLTIVPCKQILAAHVDRNKSDTVAAINVSVRRETGKE